MRHSLSSEAMEKWRRVSSTGKMYPADSYGPSFLLGNDLISAKYSPFLLAYVKAVMMI